MIDRYIGVRNSGTLLITISTVLGLENRNQQKLYDAVLHWYLLKNYRL